MVRLTQTERLLIEDKSRKAGMKPSEWFRRSAKNAKVTPCFSAEETGWLRMLAGLANNLNQLTRLAHVQGLLSLSGKCREMLKLTNEVLTKIRSHGR